MCISVRIRFGCIREKIDNSKMVACSKIKAYFTKI